MKPEDLMRLIDELWPRCELPDKVPVYLEGVIRKGTSR